LSEFLENWASLAKYPDCWGKDEKFLLPSIPLLEVNSTLQTF